ncbi:hypothetical protein RclHR1_17100002 [Rhizophagus clarus]|uniref:RRM domain-containing protein n=1 Tax=Rhizophagus clarus TaxID=94130 RepID=A0A2Z6QJB1_9GLOM|nr:hypothetical protein RclHR1_17100002 [Rhizophagus clarus]GES79074.1 hypothetical protein GLOIN_2v1783541 [Rhizophagus clarus]
MSPQSCSAYIGGFTEETTEDMVSTEFSHFADIVNCEKKTGLNRCYFKITFIDISTARKAVNQYVWQVGYIFGCTIFGSMYESQFTHPLVEYPQTMMKIDYFPHPSSLISLEDKQLLSNVLTPKIYSNFEEKFKDPVGIKFGCIRYYKLSPLRRKQQKLYQDLPTFNPTNNIEENNSLLSWLGDASLNTEIMNYVYRFSLSYYLTSDDLNSICSCLKSNITLAFLARFLGLSTQAGLIGFMDKRDSDLLEAYIGALTLKAGSNSKLASNIIIEFVHRTLGGLFRKLIQNRSFFSRPYLSVDRKIEYHVTLINYFYSVDDSLVWYSGLF